MELMKLVEGIDAWDARGMCNQTTVLTAQPPQADSRRAIGCRRRRPLLLSVAVITGLKTMRVKHRPMATNRTLVMRP